MAIIGRWNGHTFELSGTVIRGFTGLKIKGSCETEDKTSSNQKYVSRKNGKPAEVSLTVVLNSAFGCDVRTEAMNLVSEAASGAKDYFYVGNGKLLPCKLLLTDAQVSEAFIGNGDRWTSAEVALTMKQCDKGNATGGGGSPGRRSSKKKRTRTTPPKKTNFPHFADHNELTKLTSYKTEKNPVKRVVSSAVSAINRIVSNAKRVSARAKRR